MEIKKFFSKGENLVGTGFMLLLVTYMVWLMVNDVIRMQEATSNFEYYRNLIYLIDNIARSYFFCIYIVMVYLTYIHKQYTKWCVRLFYLTGISALLYFAFANFFSESIFSHIEPEYVEKFPRMIHTLYTGPIFWIIIGYFFTPRILKDAQKLKEEQDLTI